MARQGPEVHEMMRVLIHRKVRNLPEDIIFFMQAHLRTCQQCQASIDSKRIQTILDYHIEEMPEDDLLPACGITRYYQALRGEETPNDLQEWINAHIRLCADCDTVTREYAQLTLGLQNLPDPLPRTGQLVLPPRTPHQQTHYLRLLLLIVIVAVVAALLLLLFLYR